MTTPELKPGRTNASNYLLMTTEQLDHLRSAPSFMPAGTTMHEYKLQLAAVSDIAEHNLRIRMQRFIEEHLRARALRIRNARREAANTAWETQVMDHAESMRQLLKSHLEGETEMSPFNHIAFDPEHLKFLESGGYESGQGFA